MSEIGDSDTDLPFDEDDNVEAKLEILKNEISSLERENKKVREQILDSDAEQSKYKKKLQRLTHENKKLKDAPLFVATVKEIKDEGIIIKQHGNNQEVFTDAPESLREDLEPDMRVMLNNSLSIVDILEVETDHRTRVMQVEESPTVTYEDIGGLEEQVLEVRETVELPLTDNERFNSIGVSPPSGVLLYGPPGTGKTMMARAVANETNATFIKMAGSELVQKYIGEGARLVRDLFELAEKESPAIIFIDEIDAIATKRTDSKTSGDAEVQRTLMQLLSSMDGFNDHSDVRIIGATNRFDMLDDAIIRPGRFDRIIEVPEPDEEGRTQIFKIHTRDMTLADDISFEELAALSSGASGADVKAICTEAGMRAIRDDRREVEMADFEDAADEILSDDRSDIDGERHYQ